MNLATLFEFAVDREPNRVAVIDGQQSYTFQAVNEEVNRVAASLQRVGIGPRDRVMVLLKNRKQTVCLFWALQKLGAIFTPVNFQRSPTDIAYCIEDTEPKAIVYEDFIYPAIPKVNLPSKPIYINIHTDDGDITYQELVDNGSADFSSIQVGDDDIALMLYTSGTSGVPKGVPRSHKNETAATLAHIIQNRYDRFETTLGAMPLYHTMGLHSLLAMAVLNGTYVSLPDFDGSLALEAITKHQVSCLYMVPMMFHQLLKNSRHNTFDLSSVRKIGYAGAPMSRSMIEECNQLFKPHVFLNHYGSTELYTFAFNTNVIEKPGCVGKPGINQDVRLISLASDASVEDEAGRGKIGQIIVNMASDDAFRGYWNRPELTRKAIRDKWYFTGDIGRLDEDGDLYVVGRIDDLVISGVEHVSPFKVEEFLSGHERVAEVAVVGDWDERWGQIVVAHVVPKDTGLTALELDRFCKQSDQLSSFERPRKYIFVPELPKGPTGKVIRRNLLGKGDRGSD